VYNATGAGGCSLSMTCEKYHRIFSAAYVDGGIAAYSEDYQAPASPLEVELAAEAASFQAEIDALDSRVTDLEGA
jgi:hypothetical protein